MVISRTSPYQGTVLEGPKGQQWEKVCSCVVKDQCQRLRVCTGGQEIKSKMKMRIKALRKDSYQSSFEEKTLKNSFFWKISRLQSSDPFLLLWYSWSNPQVDLPHPETCWLSSTGGSHSSWLLINPLTPHCDNAAFCPISMKILLALFFSYWSVLLDCHLLKDYISFVVASVWFNSLPDGHVQFFF